MTSTATQIDISPKIVNLTFRQGTDVDGTLLKFLWKAGGVAVDLANYQATAEFGSKLGVAPVVTLKSDDSQIILNEVTGQIEMVFPANLSDALTAFKNGVYIGTWVFNLIRPNGRVRKLMAGDWIVLQDFPNE